MIQIGHPGNGHVTGPTPRWLWGFLIMGLSLAANSGLAAATTDPTHTVRELVQVIASMKDKGSNAKAATKANAIVDIPSVSRRGCADRGRRSRDR